MALLRILQATGGCGSLPPRKQKRGGHPALTPASPPSRGRAMGRPSGYWSRFPRVAKGARRWPPARPGR